MVVKLDSMVDYWSVIPAVISGLLIVTAYILILINARVLSKAKSYGLRKREVCGNEYLERETARYELFKAYDGMSRRLMRVSNLLLMIGLGLPFVVIITSYVLIGTRWKKSKDGKISFSGSQKTAYVITIIFSVMVMISFMKFIIAEGSNKKISKYLTKSTQRFDANDRMRSVKVLTIAVPILMIFGMTTYLREPDQRNPIDYVHMASVGVIAVILLLIARDRTALQRDIYHKYMDAKTTLHDVVTGMLVSPEFRRYLDINIRRAHPKAQGEGLVDEEPYASNLYAYVEHRPGRDSFNNNAGYTSVFTAKEAFCKYILNASSLQKRYDLIDLLEMMYVQGESVDTFKLTDIDSWLKDLFPAAPEPITKNPWPTAAGEGVVIDVSCSTTRPVPSNSTKSTIHTTIMAILDKAAKSENNAVKSLSYETLSKELEQFKKPFFTADNKAITLTPEQTIHVNNLMSYIVYRSNYKNRTEISFESIQYYLETSNTVPETVIAELRDKFDDIEKSRVSDGKILNFQKALRAARSVEEPALKSTNAHLRHVLTISCILLAILVYVIVRVCMETVGPEKTYIMFSGGLLLAVFAITWYSWFYAKLML